MPQYQLDLIFEDSAIQMQAQANKDINTEKLGLRVSWDIFYTEKKKSTSGAVCQMELNEATFLVVIYFFVFFWGQKVCQKAQTLVYCLL